MNEKKKSVLELIAEAPAEIRKRRHMALEEHLESSRDFIEDILESLIKEPNTKIKVGSISFQTSETLKQAGFKIEAKSKCDHFGPMQNWVEVSFP